MRYLPPVSFILGLIGSMLALDVLWWAAAARAASRRTWRICIAIFFAAQIGGLLWIIGARMTHSQSDRALPKFATSAIFIWHFLGHATLLALVSASAAALPLFGVYRLIRKRRRPALPPPRPGTGEWTRRDFIGAAAALAPPLFTFGLAGLATAQLNQFRIRRFELPLASLPRQLDGVTIAHVSDTHVGRFTSGAVLRKIVDATNRLRADLVLFTGDLINDALADLSSALDHLAQMEGRSGLWMIEGNHDLIEDGAEFERRVRASGMNFLLQQSALVPIRGVPVQLFGLRWTRSLRADRDEAIGRSVRSLLADREPEAFPILLAHHPHAFDAAAAAGVSLTLAGHTHGGQLMWNEQLGFGPAIFRYWSGQYRRAENHLIVSNGVGNWFPVRANAPAEIMHITLRAQDVPARR
jgi:predicted MPP superfamily phosphohydrolase